LERKTRPRGIEEKNGGVGVKSMRLNTRKPGVGSKTGERVLNDKNEKIPQEGREYDVRESSFRIETRTWREGGIGARDIDRRIGIRRPNLERGK